MSRIRLSSDSLLGNAFLKPTWRDKIISKDDSWLPVCLGDSAASGIERNVEEVCSQHEKNYFNGCSRNTGRIVASNRRVPASISEHGLSFDKKMTGGPLQDIFSSSVKIIKISMIKGHK